ncbi:nitroreductase family deazaflavin-dependent oxidoreductase [Kribbella monticola]|uniref:nitroreductase family deazaflavin-dependent oxidoreductase n=1 Tax=Kribbella monticola TaxID=2185285 RepID=UPI0018E54754|nr:nitroreductase family deazaflavin-dependent oxidoreductase [Kribbella monticola]
MTQQASAAVKYRRMVNRINKVIIGLQRIGIAFGSMYLLTVPGRRTGQPRTFPIAVLPLSGDRYVVQAFPNAAWVANARAADTATLKRGRRSSAVRLVEVPVQERGPLLREVVETQPASAAQRYVTNGLAAAPTPDAVAAAADRIAIFRIEQL